jgi:light-regulated signal transduction histidine kinase (bacteriophytochrome)
MELEPIPTIDTQRVLREVLERLNGSITASEASVTSNELPLIAMHESQLAQVLQNLISNAIKYRSIEPPRIRVEASARNHFWEFSVSDNGIGIDPVFREHIFGLFKRLHSQVEYQGSGMGLAICQRIVEQYGGNIWLARAEPGQGSTFCFSIPIKSELEFGQRQELRGVSLHTAT